MKTLLIAALAALAVFAAPAAADAGCLAYGGAISYEPTHDATMGYGGISCTTVVATNHYQLRIYHQADDGGWHIVGPGVTYDIYNAPPNWRRTYGPTFVSCGYYASAATHARVKAVVDNMNTTGLSVAYGPAMTLPSGC